MSVIKSREEFDALPVGSRVQFDYLLGDVAQFEKQEDGLWLTIRDDIIPTTVGHKGDYTNVGGDHAWELGYLSVIHQAADVAA